MDVVADEKSRSRAVQEPVDSAEKMAQAAQLHIFLTTADYVTRLFIRWGGGATSRRAQQHTDKLDFKGRVSSSLPREGMAAWHEFSTIKVRSCWLVFHLAVTI